MKHFKKWGAAYVLLVLWLSNTYFYYYFKLLEAKDQASSHKEPFNKTEFWHEWWAALFENLQSEWGQLLLQALLFLGPLSLLIWKADQQASKEDVDKIMKRLDELEK